MSYSILPAGVYAPLVKEFEMELSSIAEWWVANATDARYGGFVGEIDARNVTRPEANRGGVLYGRILWFFSEAALFTGRDKYKQMAGYAYDYLMAHFWDHEYEGIYWEIDCHGKPAGDYKHVYAQAFAIYGLCAYYKLTGDTAALSKAMRLYKILESVAHDPDNEGYIEAFSRTWTKADDFRLSPDEPNFPRSMNAHLHILEAYTALYRVAPGEDTEFSLRRIVSYFIKYFVNAENFHLRIFLDLEWHDVSAKYSYGHEMEFSWLLWEAAEALDDKGLLSVLKPVVLNMVDNCLSEGMGERGELLDGYDLHAGKPLDSRPWWVQAEALVGFLNAYTMTGKAEYFGAFEGVWAFIKNYQLDKKKGEWHWLATPDQGKDYNAYKAGFWKCPYHNGRAMMESCKRLHTIEQGSNRHNSKRG
jgi:cellobiose epimerase